MIKPSGMSGAYCITVPTPKVRRSLIGDLLRCLIRYASVPVGDKKSLFMNALLSLPLTTFFTISAFRTRLEFVSFCAASRDGKDP